MNTRHIQSFLIVSASAQMLQIVPAQDAVAQPSAARAAESKASVR